MTYVIAALLVGVLTFIGRVRGRVKSTMMMTVIVGLALLSLWLNGGGWWIFIPTLGFLYSARIIAVSIYERTKPVDNTSWIGEYVVERWGEKAGEALFYAEILTLTFLIL